MTADNSIQLANPSPTHADGSKGKGTSKRFEVELHVTLSDRQSFSFPTTWMNQTTDEKLFQITDHFALLPTADVAKNAQYAKDNLQDMMRWFSQIDSISSMIATLYAEPSADYTSLFSALTQDDFKTHSQNSVFNMYGNINVSELGERLSDQDVQAFKTMGDENLIKVISTIKAIKAAILSLKSNEARLKDNFPEQYFGEHLKALGLWYEQSMAMMTNNYQGWQTQEPTMLEVKAWEQYDSAKIALFTDSSTTLYEQIQKMITSTNQATQGISQNAQVVKDNSEQFIQLVNQATTTQKDAQTLLANTDTLVLTGSEETNKSKGFYDGFSKTLGNTRTPGVNTQNIYNFFANPILSSDVTPKQDKKTMKQHLVDWRLPMLFSMGMISGCLLLLIGQSIVKKEHLAK